MNRIFALLMSLTFCNSAYLFAQPVVHRDTCNFMFENKKMSGFLYRPQTADPTALLIIVPGYGETNFNKGNRYYGSLIDSFLSRGLACFVYDKQGCGKSAGVFDINQSVRNSADEILTAIKELKHRNIKGSSRIGLWGISRAGWICPLVINDDPSIAFWISVSGVDDKENYAYLMECRFRIEGNKSAEEAKMLASEWTQGTKIAGTGGSPEEYLKATRHLQEDTFLRSQPNWTPFDRESYLKNQKKSINKSSDYDEVTGLYIYVHGFREILNNVQCPVLSISGEKDCNVNWRKTIDLYNETIGSNGKSELTVKTLPGCNHNMQQCDTGMIGENLGKYNWRACDGYYDAMLTWLKEHGLAN